MDSEIQIKDLRAKPEFKKNVVNDDINEFEIQHGHIELQKLKLLKPDSSNVIDIPKSSRTLLIEKEKEENVRLWMVSNCVDIVEALNLFETPSLVDELKSVESILVIKFQIDENFVDLNSREINDLSRRCREKAVLIVLISKIGDKISIFWKTKEVESLLELKVYDDKSLDDKKIVCQFIVDFLKDSLKNGHIGLHSGYLCNNTSSKIEIHMLANAKDYNLLLLAAYSGNCHAAKLFLESGLSPYTSDRSIDAQSLALAGKHNDVLLMLLKFNLTYPDFIEVKKCPAELKNFINTSMELHKAIKAGDENKVDEILSQKHSRHYYNLLNESAPKVAIDNKKIDMYEKLLVNKVLFGPNENINEIMCKLEEDDKKYIRDIHLKHSIDMPEKHINTLVANSYVGHEEVTNVEAKLDHIRNAFRILNKNPFLKIILMIVAAAKKFRIIFDFNRDSVEFVDPTTSSSEYQTAGLFYLSGRIYIGAKQLLSEATRHLALATIAHELCHFAMEIVFKNSANPYSSKNDELMQKVKKVSFKCQKQKGKEDIVDMVYECYPDDMHHAELIVRAPHMMAYYANEPDKMDESRENFVDLYNLYEQDIVPTMKKALPEIETRIEKEMARKDKEISKLRKIVALVVIMAVIVVTIILNTRKDPEPAKSYNYEALNRNEKDMIKNFSIVYAGTNVQLGKIFKNDDEIKIAFHSDHFQDILTGKNISVDLNSADYSHIEPRVLFDWQNLAEPLKDKFMESTCNFQGENVKFSELYGVYNKTFRYLTSESIKKVLNSGSMSVGEPISNVPKICVKRTFKISESSSIVTENDVLSNITSGYTFILGDDPGTGKTATFKNMAKNIKSVYPLKWVTFVEAGTFEKNIDKCDVLDKFFGLETTFDKAVFFEASYTQNAVILWDSFEDVVGEKLTKNLQNFQTKYKNVLLLNSRSSEDYLFWVFGILPFKLNPLNKEEQKEFFKCKSESINGDYNETAIILVQDVLKHVDEKSRNNPSASNLTTPLILETIANDYILNDNGNLYEFFEKIAQSMLKSWENKPLSTALRHKILKSEVDLIKTFEVIALKYEKKLAFNKIHLKMSNLNILNYKVQSKNIGEFSEIGITSKEFKQQFAYKGFNDYFIAKYIFKSLNDPENCAYTDEEIEIRLDLFFYFVRVYGHNQWLVTEFLNDIPLPDYSGETEKHLNYQFYLHTEPDKSKKFCSNIRTAIMKKYSHVFIDLLDTDHPEIFEFLFKFFGRDLEILKLLLQVDQPETLYTAIFNPIHNAYYIDPDYILKLAKSYLEHDEHLFEDETQLQKFITGNNRTYLSYIGSYFYRTSKIPKIHEKGAIMDIDSNICDLLSSKIQSESEWIEFINSSFSSIILIDSMLKGPIMNVRFRRYADEIVSDSFEQSSEEYDDDSAADEYDDYESAVTEAQTLNTIEFEGFPDYTYEYNEMVCPDLDRFWIKVDSLAVDEKMKMFGNELSNFLQLSASNTYFQKSDILKVLLTKSEELLSSPLISKMIDDWNLLHKAAENSKNFKLMWSYFIKHVTDIEDMKRILFKDVDGIYKYDKYLINASSTEPLSYRSRYFEKNPLKPLQIALLSSDDKQFINFVLEAHKMNLTSKEIMGIMKSSIEFIYDFILFTELDYCTHLGRSLASQYFNDERVNFNIFLNTEKYQKYPLLKDLVKGDFINRWSCADLFGVEIGYNYPEPGPTMPPTIESFFLELFCSDTEIDGRFREDVPGWVLP